MPSERDLVSGVLQLGNLLNRRLAPVFEKAKITPQQWFVLAALGTEESPVTLVALARRLMVTKQNMTGMITRLEQLGFAERQDDPSDLRSSKVSLSRKGRSLVERFRPAYEQWLRSIGEGLPERELTALSRTTEKLIESLDS